MAKVYGKASSFISFNFKKDAAIYAGLTVVFIIGVFVCYLLAQQQFGNDNLFVQILLFILYLIALFFLARTLKYLFRIDNFARGGSAEEYIAKDLALLPDNYVIFRNLQINGSKYDTDFIVIGPKGILTIEVKSHSGEINFDGYQLTKNSRLFEKDFLKQAKVEALDLAKFLTRYGFDGFIKPIVVFSSKFAHIQCESIVSHVGVIQRSKLRSFIYSQPDINTNIPLKAIFEVLFSQIRK